MIFQLIRGDSQLGRYTGGEIREGLTSGRLKASDLIREEGGSEWQTLGEVFDPTLANLKAPPLTTSPPDASASWSGLPLADIPPVSGLAVAALALGIISFCTLGLLGIGSLAAIICGHLGLSKIRRSANKLRGRGMALTGSVLGYFSLILAIGSLSLLFLTKPAGRSELSKTMLNCKQVVVACQMFAFKDGGRFPDSLDQLVSARLLEAEALEKILATSTGEIAFEYKGRGLTLSDDGDTVIMQGLIDYCGGKYMIGRLDGTVSLEQIAP